MPFELHWLRPLWLLLLPLVVLCVYLAWRYQQSGSPWRQLLPTHLQLTLLNDKVQQQQNKKPFVLLLLGLLLAVIALAGPSVHKLPQPAFALNKATVLVLDMSLSMLATDVKPNRLTQARFKALDFTSQLKEGELALLTFAADAYVISPLTPDHNNIKLLLPDLTPEIMPAQGSNVQSALELAAKLLQQAGYPKGDVVLITDGFSQSHYQTLRQSLNDFPHRLSVLAVGSSDGAPVKLSSGELLKDRNGSIVLPKVPLTQLKELASLTGGVFRQSSFDQSDIQALLALPELTLAQADTAQSSKISGDQWQDAGVYLCWLLLPLALWLGKRAALLAILPLCLLPNTAKAFDWRDLWQSQQQQAKQAYQQQDYAKAMEKFADPLWQGNAAYRSGDYQAAEQLYQQDKSANGRFNLGNSLMQQQKFAEALTAYQQAQNQQPDLPGLEQNIELAKQLLQQQQDQQQNSAQNQQGGQSKDGKQQEGQNQEGQPQDGQQKDDQAEQSDGSGQNDSKDGQNPEQTEQNNPSEPGAQQESKQQNKEQAQQQPEANPEQPNEQTEQQKAVREAWPNASPEQSQQLDGLMRKVQDDPALLLRNKMLLEYQKRQQQRLPKGAEQEW